MAKDDLLILTCPRIDWTYFEYKMQLIELIRSFY